MKFMRTSMARMEDMDIEDKGSDEKKCDSDDDF